MMMHDDDNGDAMVVVMMVVVTAVKISSHNRANSNSYSNWLLINLLLLHTGYYALTMKGSSKICHPEKLLYSVILPLIAEGNPGAKSTFLKQLPSCIYCYLLCHSE